MARFTLSYTTGRDGHAITLHAPYSVQPTRRVCEFPDDSPIFLPSGEWNMEVLPALIATLVREYNLALQED